MSHLRNSGVASCFFCDDLVKYKHQKTCLVTWLLLWKHNKPRKMCCDSTVCHLDCMYASQQYATLSHKNAMLGKRVVMIGIYLDKMELRIYVIPPYLRESFVMIFQKKKEQKSFFYCFICKITFFCVKKVCIFCHVPSSDSLILLPGV